MTSTTSDPTTPTEPAPPVPRRRDRAAREREILDAAELTFGERGYQGTSMDDVAAAAGVSKPLVYQYYGSKDGLFVATLSRLRAQLLDYVSDSILAAPDTEKAMYAGLVAWFTFLDEHPRAWAVMVDEGMLTTGPAAEAADAVRTDFVNLIATMIRLNQSAESPYDDEEVQIVAQSISGATERLAIWRTRSGGGPAPEKTATTLMGLFWVGLASLQSGQTWP